MLTGKHVLLGITGGIAAYKTANLASMLVKLHADVHVIMTKNAEKFISPVVFEALTGNKVEDDVFDSGSEYHIPHIEMAREADVVMIAPASANIIAKAQPSIATVNNAVRVPMVNCMVFTLEENCRSRKRFSPL